MRVIALRTHLDSSQVTRRKGESFELSEREGAEKIRRGLVGVEAEAPGRGQGENKQLPAAPERGKPVRADKAKGPITNASLRKPGPGAEDQ